MPELPDLEVFAANLERRFKNKKLARLDVVVDKKLNVSTKEVKEKLTGQTVKAVKREGKTLQLHFSNDNVLGLHLMLHGRLQDVTETTDLKHAIIVLLFEGGNAFALTDFQKAATPTLNPQQSTIPDALSDQITENYLQEKLAKKKTPIKTVLMDQHTIRGIGNTYADEILWEARISPMSTSKAIPVTKVRELHQVIRKLLKQEIAHIRKMLPNELGGEIKDFLKIHGPRIVASPTGKKIMVNEVGGRKTYYTEEQELFQ